MVETTQAVDRRPHSDGVACSPRDRPAAVVLLELIGEVLQELRVSAGPWRAEPAATARAARRNSDPAVPRGATWHHKGVVRARTECRPIRAVP